MDELLPPEVQRLIDSSLASMDHVEVLFRIGREKETTAEWLARNAHIAPAVVAKVLRDLEHAGLITTDGTSYRVTENSRERAAVEEFVATYNAKPVTLIRAVYARPSPLRSFADAFRIRRDE